MRWALVVVISLLTPVSCSQQPTLSELLYQAQQAERTEPKTAIKLYQQALELAPNSVVLMLKIAKLMLQWEPESEREAAQFLCKAWKLLLDEPITTAALRREIFQMLFHPLPTNPDRNPFLSLSLEERKEFITTLRENDPALTKAQIATAYLLAKEFEKGIDLFRQAVIEEYWGVVRFLPKMGLTEEHLKQIRSKWREEALKTNNPKLWLAVIELDLNLKSPSFYDDFKIALEVVKGNNDLMKDLAGMMLRAGFREGYWEVYALIKPSYEPKSIWDFLAGFDHALATQNLTMAKAWLEAFVASAGTSHIGDFLAPHRIQKMLQNGWRDWLAELLTPERFSIHILSWILKEEELSEERFNFWVKRFLRPDDENRWSALKTALKSLYSELKLKHEDEKAARIAEWSSSLFSEDTNFLGWLAENLKTQGHLTRAYEAYRLVFTKVASVDLVAQKADFKILWRDLDEPEERITNWSAKVIHSLFELATKLKLLSELREWLWSERQKFALPFYVLLAKQWWREKDYNEAIRWLEEALRIAKEQNWTDDAYLQALYNSSSMWMEQTKLRIQFARTEGLFYPETYVLRIRCLLALGRKDNASQVANEAKNLYPIYPFHAEIPEWKDLIGTEPSETIGSENHFQESAVDLPVKDLLTLAWTLIRTDHCDIASKLASKAFPDKPHLEQGLLLAIDLFRRRVDGSLPFWEWLQALRGDYAWNFIIRIASTVKSIGDPSLANAFVLTVLLCTDESLYAKATRKMISRLWEQGRNWQALKPEDKTALEAMIAKRLNPFALRDLLESTHDDSFRNWLSHLHIQFACRSATLLLSLMEQYALLIPKEHWQAWLNALSVIHWDCANDDLIGFRVRRILVDLNRRKLSEEACSLLEIALQKLSPEQKLELSDWIAYLGVKVPDPKNGGWAGGLLKVKVVKSLQRRDEAINACLTALKLTPSVREKLEVLDILAELDPSAAFNEVSTLVVALKSKGKQEDGIRRIGPVLLKVAKQDKGLAEKVVPLVVDLKEVLPEWWTRDSMYFRNFAWIYFLADKPHEGVEILFSSWSEPRVRPLILSSAIDTMVVSFLPLSAKQAIFQRLKSLSEWGEFTGEMWAEAFRFTEFLTASLRERDAEGKISPTLDLDNLNLIANILETSVLSFPSVSEGFLKEVLWQFARFAGEPIYTSKVAPAWFQVVVKAIQKLALTLGGKNKAGEWLREWLANAERKANSYFTYQQFVRSKWFKKLNEFANELLIGR